MKRERPLNNGNGVNTPLEITDMPRIPRSEATVDFRPTPQPFSTGDGFEAPGRGLAKIGQGISAMGDAFASLQGVADKHDEFMTKVSLYEASNAQDLADQQRQATFNPDKDDPDQFYQNSVQEFEGRFGSIQPKSQAGQRMVALQSARMRGVVAERAYRFRTQQVEQRSYNAAERSIGGIMDQLTAPQPDLPDEPTPVSMPSPAQAARDPNQVGPTVAEGAEPAPAMVMSKDERIQQRDAQRLDTALEASWKIIQDLPMSITAKERLANQAAERAAMAFGTKKFALPAAEAWLERSRSGIQPGGVQGTEGGVLLPDGKEGPSGIPAAKPGTPGVISAITHQPYRTFNSQGYGDKTTGQITVNGRTYEFVNGGVGRGSIPLGEYGVKRFTSGSQRAAEGFQYRKDAFELTDVRDDAPGTKGQAPRQGLLIHDGNRGVTAGCIGIKGDFQQFKADLMAEAQKNGGRLPRLQLGAPQKGEQMALGVGSTATDASATAVSPIRGTVTAYSPQAGASNTNSMEGNYQAARPGPDGQAVVRTVDDFMSGKSKYITLAGNPKFNGREYTIPRLEVIGKDGKPQVLENVPAVVHDTGSAFKNAPEGRFDIPIGRDADNGAMAANHAAWRKSGVEFLPADKGGPRVASWGAQEGARGTNTIPGSQQMAQAGGMAPAPMLSPVHEALRDRLQKALPGMREQFRKQVDGAVNQIEEMAAKGYEVDDATIGKTAAMVTATRDPAMMQRMELLSTIVRNSRATNQANPQELTAVIQQMEAQALKGPVTPQQVAAIEHFKQKRTEIDNALGKNPYELGSRNGVLPGPVAPLKPDANPEELAAGLQQRTEARAAMMQRYGRSLPFFTSEEKENFTAFLKKGGKDTIGVLGMLHETWGKDMPAAMAEISKDAPDIATIGWLVSQTAEPSAIKAASDGLALRASHGFISRIPKEADLDTTIRSTAVPAFQGNPKALGMAVETAKLIYEAEAFAKGLDGKVMDSDLWQSSLNKAMGQNKVGEATYGGMARTGSTWGFGGTYVYVPPTVKADGGLDEIMSKLKPSDLAALPTVAALSQNEALRPTQAEGARDPAQTGPTAAEGERPTPRIGMPVDAQGRPVAMAVVRSAIPVWLTGSQYALRTGTDANGKPTFLKAGGLGDADFRIDLDKLRPLMEGRVAKGTFRPSDNPPTIADILKSYRPEPAKPQNDNPERPAFTPRFAPGKR